jgi:DNA-binding helix-hairpin-helix protein with protein kinase domain
MSLERAISERRFAYGKDTRSRMMKQPPGTLDLDAIPSAVSSLFERAFLEEQDRPVPAEWIAALGDLSGNLRHCFYNKNHSFYKSVSTCPWCEIGVESGALLFNPPWNPALPAVAGVNLPAIWKEIETTILPEPAMLPTQPELPSLLTTSDERVRNWRRKIYTLIGASAAIIFISIVLAISAIPLDIALAVILTTGTLGIMLIHKATGDMMIQLESAKEEAEIRWHFLKDQWFCESERAEFKELQTQLQKKKTEYQSLSRQRQERIEKLEADLKRQQLNNYLAGIPISNGHEVEIEETSQRILESHGIKAAVNVEPTLLAKLSEVDWHTAKRLLDWRQSVEKRFVFDPPTGFGESAIQTIDREMMTLKTNLEREMENGQKAIQRLNKEVRSVPAKLRPEIEEVLLRLAQLDADSTVGIESHAPMGLLIVAIIVSLIIVLVSK